MKEKIRQKMQETKADLVLEHVSDYFDKVGFSQATMQEIAAAVGISVGALYKLFPSKDALLDAYVEYQIRQFEQALRTASAHIKDPRQSLILFIQMKFSTFASKKKALEDPVLGDPFFFLKIHTRKADAAESIMQFLAEQFDKLQKEVPFKSENHLKTAYLFNSYTMGFIEYWINYGGTLEEQAEKIFEGFLHGQAYCQEQV
ncbi:MAG TPA: TetR/AcrR family transcriptional regulator [Campylobacteraceae bacterium]|nr:TetR/AcrR family transcriptional regulator [Campylobacteraceae bacterium]